MTVTETVADYWREMVTVALLGTDRRDPPSPLAGGLADLAADDPQPTPSQRLLQQVAGCAVAHPGIAARGLLDRPVTRHIYW